MANRDEVFKTIEGFPNYAISNRGKVMSYTFKKDGKLLNPQKDGGGYRHVRLYDGTDARGTYANGDNKPKLEKVHRLVAEHFLPQPDRNVYLEVNHIDGDKENNDVTNLEWMTRKENIQHAWDNGLMENGRREGGAKRRKPVRITYMDGRVEYYEGRVQAAVYLGVSPMTILKKFHTDSWGKTKIKAEPIEELPEGESFVYSEEKELILDQWNKKYFGKLAQWRINKQKRLAERK